MKILRLPLVKEWFDMIASGIKKEDYREIKKHWAGRLCGDLEFRRKGDGLIPADKNSMWSHVYPKNFKEFDLVEFSNGYGANVPKIVFECSGVSIGRPKKEWGGDTMRDINQKEVDCFIISLGKEVSRVNFTCR